MTAVFTTARLNLPALHRGTLQEVRLDSAHLCCFFCARFGWRSLARPLDALNERVHVQVVAEQRAPSISAAGSGQAYDSAVSVGSTGLQVVEGLAVLAAVPAILTAREFLSCLVESGGWVGDFFFLAAAAAAAAVAAATGSCSFLLYA